MKLNPHIEQRLIGIQTILKGVHQAVVSLSSATKGGEREAFIDKFLSQVLPPLFRFGTGDATDTDGNKSGQLDVVVEYPFMPSLPIVGAATSRLYLAEGIAAVIEVKSNIANQWTEAIATANNLKRLSRRFTGALMTIGPEPTQRIPFFVVGYAGWKEETTLLQHLIDVPIDGILVIDQGLFVSTPEFMGMRIIGPASLWGLICCLHQATSTLMTAGTHPVEYVK